jgi:hypothetical protein
MKEEEKKSQTKEIFKRAAEKVATLKITKSHIQKEKRGLTWCDGSAFRLLTDHTMTIGNSNSSNSS